MYAQMNAYPKREFVDISHYFGLEHWFHESYTYVYVLISFVNLEKLLSELIASEARKFVFFSFFFSQIEITISTDTTYL